MKYDVTIILRKHINELFQILGKHNIADKAELITVAKNDIEFKKAVLMCVGYIGELSKKMDNDVKLSKPDVNWRRLEKSRNIIFHDYDIVSMTVITDVIFGDITMLREILG